jgi:hypothetical protein
VRSKKTTPTREAFQFAPRQEFVEFAHQYSVVKDLKYSITSATVNRVCRWLSSHLNLKISAFAEVQTMEMIGLEPTASALQGRRSPN